MLTDIIRDKLRPMREHGLILLYVHGNQGSLGRTAQDGHLDSHTVHELCSLPLPLFAFTDTWSDKGTGVGYIIYRSVTKVQQHYNTYLCDIGNFHP